MLGLLGFLLMGCGAAPEYVRVPPSATHEGYREQIEDLNRRLCDQHGGSLYRVWQCDGRLTWRCVVPPEPAPEPPRCGGDK